MSSKPPRPSAIADQAIGGDRELALLHLPRRVQAPFRALFTLDSAMGDVVARSTEPTLAAIKLVWWRDQLERLDREPPPAEPTLQAVAAELLPLGIGGAELAELEDGWTALLEARVDPTRVAQRGIRLFAIGGRLLGADSPDLGDAGALWALTSVARRGVPELADPARPVMDSLRGHRFRRGLRSLTGLARLAARDIELGPGAEPEGSPARAAAYLRHRWSGVVVLRG